jgi:mono/diheme cytochrome c family protein
MNANITSFTANTSSAFAVAAKNEPSMGWSAMPAFPVAAVEQDVVLGWDAMPAFGKASVAQCDAEMVAEFIRETRAMRPAKVNVLSNFWSMMAR